MAIDNTIWLIISSHKERNPFWLGRIYILSTFSWILIRYIISFYFRLKHTHTQKNVSFLKMKNCWNCFSFWTLNLTVAPFRSEIWFAIKDVIRISEWGLIRMLLIKNKATIVRLLWQTFRWISTISKANTHTQHLVTIIDHQFCNVPGKCSE